MCLRIEHQRAVLNVDVVLVVHSWQCFNNAELVLCNNSTLSHTSAQSSTINYKSNTGRWKRSLFFCCWLNILLPTGQPTSFFLERWPNSWTTQGTNTVFSVSKLLSITDTLNHTEESLKWFAPLKWKFTPFLVYRDANATRIDIYSGWIQ